MIKTIIKYGLIAYSLGRFIKSRMPNIEDVKEYLSNALTFDIKELYDVKPLWTKGKIWIKISLLVKNNLNIPIKLPEGAVQLKRLDVFYKNKKIGEADLKNIKINFNPGETKEIRDIEALLHFNIQTIANIISNWPIPFDYELTFEIMGKEYTYKGTYKIE